jgi:CRP/FNR family cyclic AMP-dependent transcriptional regulator
LVSICRGHPAAPSDKAILLGNHPLFRELDREAHARVAAYATTRHVARGETIFMKGDAGASLFAVCSGMVEVLVPSAEGKNAVINLVNAGEIFGEIALLDGHPRTTDALAFTDCILMVLERRDFLPLLREQPEIAVRLLELLCGRIRETTEQIEEIMFLDLESRLAKALLRLARSSQTPARISITQRALSEIVGVSREETNKQLQLWRKDRIVRLERGSIVVLQAEALARIAAA